MHHQTNILAQRTESKRQRISVEFYGQISINFENIKYIQEKASLHVTKTQL